jgi:hypothetical protein
MALTRCILYLRLLSKRTAFLFYVSEWLNGMAHGKGIETFADGTVRHDGLWREDEPII